MKNKNEWVLLGSFGVDSGQVVITDPCYLNEWVANDYKDKRVYLDTISGRGYVLGHDFNHFDDVIRDGKTMNELISFGEIREEIRNISNEYSYEGSCDTTLYSKRMGGVIGLGCDGVVASTGYGDGYYPVYAKYEDKRIKEISIRFF